MVGNAGIVIVSSAFHTKNISRSRASLGSNNQGGIRWDQKAGGLTSGGIPDNDRLVSVDLRHHNRQLLHHHDSTTNPPSLNLLLSVKMVTIYVAYTQSINPAGTTPILSRAQVWAGLQRKVRRAQEFVAPITSCTVLNEDGNVVTRDVFFKAPFGDPNKAVREVCVECEPTKVECILHPLPTLSFFG